jgi:DNA-binding HxlR family transcriptional regulator
MDSKLNSLSETAQMLLGAFAMADVHTLTAREIEAMSNGVISQTAASEALDELVAHSLAERHQADELTAYRLTKDGLELSLKLQAALAERRGAK